MDPSRPTRLPEGAYSITERDEVLATATLRSLHDLGAAAVTAFLHAPGGKHLNAAVVAVSPLGVGVGERFSADDDVYASSVAYRSGRVATTQSIEVMAKHPEMAVFAPAPYTVAAAPLFTDSRRFGTLTVFWPRLFRVVTDAERQYLTEAGATLSGDLDRLAASGVSMESPKVPWVITGEAAPAAAGEAGQVLAQGRRSDPDATPLMYHLHNLASLLSMASRTEDAAALVLERIMSAFGARAMAISLVEGDRLRVVGASGCSKEFLSSLNGMPLSGTSPETAAIARGSQLDYPGNEKMTQGRVESPEPGCDDCMWVVLPLLTTGRAVGACSIGFVPMHSRTVAAQAVLTALATLLGQTFERTQLYDAQHSLAQKLQEALLPRMLPQPLGLAITSRYVPTTSGIELGGDWYDVINLPAGGVAAVVGDVQGHNISATVVMGQLRSAVRAYATEGHDPCAVLSRTNQLLLDLDTDLFATCCCVWLDPDTGITQIATAGHQAPLIRTADGRYLARELDAGIPLGIEPDPDYRATDLTLEPGTLLALYTGVLSGSADDVRVTFESAVAAAAGQLEAMGDALSGGTSTCAARADDAALLLIRYEGLPAEARHHVAHTAVQRRDLQGVGRTRDFLRGLLQNWELPHLTDQVELLASEVVTNALIHGNSNVNLCIRRYPEHLRVEVRDSDPHPARPVLFPRAEDQEEGGRGLLIVSALASTWGNSPSGRGKTVWFELRDPLVRGA